MSQPILALATAPAAWLAAGALAGYGLMMATNPVRKSLGDGWRALRRYPALWVVFGVLGFTNAAFALVTRWYLAVALPEGQRPEFMWARDAWRDPHLWLTGSPGSLWWLPRSDFAQTMRESLLPALEGVAGLFNNAVSTFPLAALAALALLLPWRGRAAVLLAELRRKMGLWGWCLYAALLCTGLAAVAKPVLYVTPLLLPPELWMRWGQPIAAVAFAFEYLLGVAVQVFALALAFAWARGLNVERNELIDFALRRTVRVLQWSALILFLAMVLIEAPLVLKNFPSTADLFPEDQLFGQRLASARAAIACFVLFGACVQVALVLHGCTWRQALREHLRLVAGAWWPLGWFVIIAAFHFLVLHAVRENVARGVGEGTALWVAWRLIAPWPAAAITGWLLASWVCVYRSHSRNLPHELHAG
jgi:hypothetical protein